MECPHKHCNGLMMTVERILDMQIRVVIDRCLICCREIERGHVPVVKEIAPQGRPKTYLRWRSPAKTGEMEL